MSSPSTATAPTVQSPSPTPQQTAEARAAFLGTLDSPGSSISASLQTRAHDIHNNVAAIEEQEKQVKAETDRLEKENKKHERVAVDAAKKLKELGDVQNWAEMLERDLLMLEETMDIADQEEDQRRDNIGADGDGKVKRGNSWF